MTFCTKTIFIERGLAYDQYLVQGNVMFLGQANCIMSFIRGVHYQRFHLSQKHFYTQLFLLVGMLHILKQDKSTTSSKFEQSHDMCGLQSIY